VSYYQLIPSKYAKETVPPNLMMQANILQQQQQQSQIRHGAFNGRNVTNQIYMKNYVQESLRFLREKARQHEEELQQSHKKSGNDVDEKPTKDTSDVKVQQNDEKENHVEESNDKAKLNEDHQKKKVFEFTLNLNTIRIS
jgi:hypothetical protein